MHREKWDILFSKRFSWKAPDRMALNREWKDTRLEVYMSHANLSILTAFYPKEAKTLRGDIFQIFEFILL